MCTLAEYVPDTPPYRVSVAPMMERTDRHFRAIARCLSRHVLLYTEMIPTQRPVRGLELPDDAGPTALQLGGSDPARLAAAASAAAGWGYAEVDLNCGCPSPAASGGEFGARLMLRPHRVAACVAAMRAATSLPVTVKHRIGVDEADDMDALLLFVDTVRAAGASAFIVHARKAWLAGLSPKENRTIPPLVPDRVYRLKELRPGLRVEYNGGVQSLAQVDAHLRCGVDGVMIGRAAYENPWLLQDIDARFFDAAAEPRSRAAVFADVVAIASRHAAAGGRVHDVARHAYGLLRGFAGAKRARGRLSSAGRELDLLTLRQVLGAADRR